MDEYLVESKCFWKGHLYQAGEIVQLGEDILPPKHFLHTGVVATKEKAKPKWTKVEKQKLTDALKEYDISVAVFNGYIKGKGIQDLQGRLKAIQEILKLRKIKNDKEKTAEKNKE